jgi:BirA family transcriptional regulator, biotin operon repressor / biotin---[acetyl-CoA-carboxylase] ligase
MNIDSEILRALRTCGEGVSGTELSQKLGISRAAIWARIEELRALGYDIEASPHRGYRLLGVPDVLHADDLLARLDGVRVIGRDIRVFQETTSTNDIVEKLARDGVKEGMAVFAESQNRGRGRLGRKWISPAGKGLWFSILLRPNLHPVAATQLTVAAASALVRAIRIQTQLRPEIKWPNDIYIHGKKVAGILMEMGAEMDRVQFVTLGIGVDVNLQTADFPPELRQIATSLRIESGKPVDRADLAARILLDLDRDYGRICRGEFASVANEWEERCSTLGHTVAIQTGARRIQGRAESLDEDGALLIRTEHGHLERIIGGDVTLEPKGASQD